jgi:ribosomal-protein-alanine N-acetyltransferase
MEHKGTVTLETERLILRRFKLDDLEPYYRNCLSEYDVWKWSNYNPINCIEDVTNVEKQFTEKWFVQYDNLNHYNWAIELKETQEVIGRIRGINPNERINQIEYAYEIGKKWWNKGLMTEAVKKTMDFFFNSVKANRVCADHAHGNPASGKVMQKSGMVYEGTMKQASICNNGLYDKVCYAVLAEDYFKNNVKR